MLQQLYYSAVVKVEWSFDACLLIGRAHLVDLSARFFGILYISSVRRRLNAHALHVRVSI